MKTKIKFMILPLLLMGMFVLFTISCNKDEDDTTTPIDNNNNDNNEDNGNNGDKICPETVTYEGYTYLIVQIGDQCWLAENLRYLPEITHEDDWGSNTEPQYAVYGYTGNSITEAKATDNYEIYGVLYNWEAASTACPPGWHLSSHDEWTELERVVCANTSCESDFPKDEYATGWRGTNEGSKLAGNESLWDSGDLTSDTEFGTSDFTALPGGQRSILGEFNFIGINGFWWSATEFTSEYAWYRRLNYDNSRVYRHYFPKMMGRSVRCVMDN